MSVGPYETAAVGARDRRRAEVEGQHTLKTVMVPAAKDYVVGARLPAVMAVRNTDEASWGAPSFGCRPRARRWQQGAAPRRV